MQEKDPTQKGQMRIQEKTKYKSAKYKKEGTRPEELETEEIRRKIKGR